MKNIQLDFIEDRTDDAGQWKLLTPLFDGYYAHLHKKGLKPATIAGKINSAAYFVINYLFANGITSGIGNIRGGMVTDFFDSWSDNAGSDGSTEELKKFRKALTDFFDYLHKDGHIERALYLELKNAPVGKAPSGEAPSNLPALYEPHVL